MEKFFIGLLLAACVTFAVAGYFSAPEKDAGGYVTVDILGVTEDGEGVVMPLGMSVRPGNGKIFVDVSRPLFSPDTQENMRTAVKAAAAAAGKDPGKYDFTFFLGSEDTTVQGPSAGAAMAIGALALLENKHIKRGYYITGKITPDGRIEPVGSVLEKAGALPAGSVLLVPANQSTDTKKVEECSVSTARGYYRTDCRIEYVPVDVEEETGVNIIEVKSLEEAAEIMLE